MFGIYLINMEEIGVKVCVSVSVGVGGDGRLVVWNKNVNMRKIMISSVIWLVVLVSKLVMDKDFIEKFFEKLRYMKVLNVGFLMMIKYYF